MKTRIALFNSRPKPLSGLIESKRRCEAGESADALVHHADGACENDLDIISEIHGAILVYPLQRLAPAEWNAVRLH